MKGIIRFYLLILAATCMSVVFVWFWQNYVSKTQPSGDYVQTPTVVSSQ